MDAIYLPRILQCIFHEKASLQMRILHEKANLWEAILHKKAILSKVSR